MNKSQQLSPVPAQWLKTLAIRPPDFRALMAAWVDPVARRKGISIYEEMLLDPQVYGSLNLLKSATLALEFNVAPRDDQDEDAKASELAQEVQMMLESFPGGLNEFLYNALSALEYGWSITEVVWGADRDKKWVPTKWIPLPQAMYGFDIDDDTGEPKAVRTWFAPTATSQTWPLENFFILRWNSRFGSPYGRSQLLSAYEAWWIKQLLRRMRNTTLDRFGTPLMIARVPRKYDAEKRKQLKGFIENLYAEAGLVTEEDVVIEMPHAGVGQGASQGFQAAIEYEDAQIAKGITGATLQANESTGTGTYAQARVHQDNFLYLVRRVSRMLEETIQRQIIDRYCRYNHNLDPADTPVIKFATPEKDDVAAIAQVIQGMAAIGAVDPANTDKDWIRERLNFPPVEEDGEGETDASEFFRQLLAGRGHNEYGTTQGQAEAAEPEEPEEDEEQSLTGRSS